MIGASNLLLKELDGLSFIESVRMKHILSESSWPSFKQQVVLKVSLLTRWFYNYLAVSCQVGRHHNSTQQAWRSQAMLNVYFASFDVLLATHVFITSNNFPFILSSTSTLQHARRDCDKYWGSLPTLHSRFLIMSSSRTMMMETSPDCENHCPDHDWHGHRQEHGHPPSPHHWSQAPSSCDPGNSGHMSSCHHLQICFNQQSCLRLGISYICSSKWKYVRMKLLRKQALSSSQEIWKISLWRT